MDEGKTATDVDLSLGLDLTAERVRPVLSWSDASGAHTFELERRALLGSSENAQICVTDRAVSRVHAEVSVADDGIWVRDLGSRNGTFIDDTLVVHARLPRTGRFRVGTTTITVASVAKTALPLWPHDRFGPLLARSSPMRELFILLANYAASDAPILVQGETGTGKDLVAQSVHEASNRSDEPLVVVDCASLPDSLLESELFGHARGAFTGAIASRAGAFEAATGGTVFLDEIGELPLSMQPKLLRVLETNTVRRLGETAHRKVDVRFIAATHRDLQAMVANGTFREDLFFRLAVLPVHVPPLRARSEDVALLVEHFLGRDVVPAAVLRELVAYAWPGNVRQLRTFAERARMLGAEVAWALTAGTKGVAPSSFDPTRSAAASSGGLALPAVPVDVPFKIVRERWVDHIEREYLKGLISKVGRNVPAMAELAELDRTYVHRMLRKHDL